MEVYWTLRITFALQNNGPDVKVVTVNKAWRSLNEGCLNGIMERFGSWPNGTFDSDFKYNSLRNFWKNLKMTKPAW